jgi:hypothetical protein
MRMGDGRRKMEDWEWEEEGEETIESDCQWDGWGVNGDRIDRSRKMIKGDINEARKECSAEI